MKHWIVFSALLPLMMGSAAAADLPEGDAGRGKMIYEQVCAYCHRLDYDEKFAPGLQGITERVSLEWLDTWLKNPNALIAKDEYAKALHDSNEYGMAMPPIPDMKDDQKRADIIEFLKTLQ